MKDQTKQTATEFVTLLNEGKAELKNHIQVRANSLREVVELSKSLGMSVSDALHAFIATATKTGILAASQGRDTSNLIEQLGWVGKVFAHSTIPKNISWDDFSAQWLAGIEAETAEQNSQVDRLDMEERIVQYVLSKNRGKQ